MQMGIDRKYGKVTTEFGNIGVDEPVVVFRAQDATLPDVLLKATQIAMILNSPARDIEILLNTFKTVTMWQHNNRKKVKIPASESSKDRLES